MSVYKYFRFCFLLTMLLCGCKADSFWDTTRIIETDKTEYDIGDEIFLTLIITPTEESKNIRLYENLKNLSISFALVNSPILNEEWSIGSSETLPKTAVKKMTITKERPFEKTLKGIIEDADKNIRLNFPELNLQVEYSKRRLRTDSIRIHGFCSPIDPGFADSLEDYFTPKDIKIRLD